MNARLQPLPLAQAENAWAGSSPPAISVSSGTVQRTLPMARPQPVTISSQPTLFVGRRVTRYAPVPA